MKRAAVFAPEHSGVARQVAGALEVLGCEVDRRPPHPATTPDTDVAVVVGLRGPLRRVAGHYVDRGARVVLIDRPHLRRGPHQYRVTPPVHSWLPSWWDATRLPALGYDVPTTRTTPAVGDGQRALLIGQVPGDTAHDMDAATLRRWAHDRLRDLLRRGYVVRWRPHPSSGRRKLQGSHEYSDPRVRPVEADIADADLVVTHNSTSGLAALWAGIPVVADGAAVYADLAHPAVGDRHVPPDPARVLALFHRVAWTQWSPEEFEVALRPAVEGGETWH